MQVQVDESMLDALGLAAWIAANTISHRALLALRDGDQDRAMTLDEEARKFSALALRVNAMLES